MENDKPIYTTASIAEIATKKVSNYLKWSDDQKLGMALYLKDNVKSYQTIGTNGSRKTLFLKKMGASLGFTCTDKQLVNGFDTLIRKYKQTKEKLDSTGFGIDPDKDKSIKEGFLSKHCPYFDILDSVLGDRPNITPPFLIQSDSENRDLTETDSKESAEVKLECAEGSGANNQDDDYIASSSHAVAKAVIALGNSVNTWF